MIHGLIAFAGRVYGNLQKFFQPLLTGEIGQTAPRGRTTTSNCCSSSLPCAEISPVLPPFTAPVPGPSGTKAQNSSGMPLARAFLTAASAAGRAQPRFDKADNTSSSSCDIFGTGGRLLSAAGAGSLSRSSSTIRSAVFLPTPGMRTSRSSSLRRIAVKRSVGRHPT